MIGRRIKKYRLEREWSQRELAKRSAINFNQISRYESGKVQPNPVVLRKLVAALGVRSEDLSGEETSQISMRIDLEIPDKFLKELFETTLNNLDQRGRNFLSEALMLLQSKKNLIELAKK